MAEIVVDWQAAPGRCYGKRRLRNHLFRSSLRWRMNEPNPLDSENLVPIHKAGSEWEGNMIVNFLRENGVEATLEAPPSVPPLDLAEELTGTDRCDGVFVLQHDADRARALVREFLAQRPETES